MENNRDKKRILSLKGSDKEENIRHRIDFLTVLHNTADNKERYIGNLRQRNLYYALAIFAALFTIGLRYPTKFYAFASAIALFSIMLVFYYLDKRYHKFIHGWRKTQKEIARAISEVINNPTQVKEVKRYYEEGEKETDAEKLHLQPIIYYLLVLGGSLNLIYHLFHLFITP